MKVIISLEEMRDAAIQYFNLPEDTIVAVDIPDEDTTEQNEKVELPEAETQPKKRRRRRSKKQIEATQVETNGTVQDTPKSSTSNESEMVLTNTSTNPSELSKIKESVNETHGSNAESQPPFNTNESTVSTPDRVEDTTEEVKVDDTNTSTLVPETSESSTPAPETQASLFDEPEEDLTQSIDNEMSLIDQVLAEEEEHLEHTPVNPTGSLFPPID